MTSELGLERLETLATHLESGKLGHKQFNFGTYNDINVTDKTPCGAAGCAIGECPIVFPDDWEFRRQHDSDFVIYRPLLKRFCLSIWCEIDSARDFFGLSMAEHDHLFHGGLQNPVEFGGVKLTDHATRKEVASNIRAFIELKRKELSS